MRWLCGLDEHGQPSAGPQYCATVCASTCAECPRPQLLPENDEVARLYSACAGRYFSGPGGQVIGLDYAQAAAAAQLLGLKRPRRAFRGLRVMEAEVLRLRALTRTTRHDHDHAN